MGASEFGCKGKEFLLRSEGILGELGMAGVKPRVVAG